MVLYSIVVVVQCTWRRQQFLSFENRMNRTNRSVGCQLTICAASGCLPVLRRVLWFIIPSLLSRNAQSVGSSIFILGNRMNRTNRSVGFRQRQDVNAAVHVSHSNHVARVPHLNHSGEPVQLRPTRAGERRMGIHHFLSRLALCPWNTHSASMSESLGLFVCLLVCLHVCISVCLVGHQRGDLVDPFFRSKGDTAHGSIPTPL
jgi:hypothetical protein